MSQCEETFCDFIGLLLFRESYLHAFAYLLAPGLLGIRSEYYPKMLDRVAALQKASQLHGISVPNTYSSLFENGEEPSNAATRLLLTISDEATKRMIEQLCTDAATFLQERGMPAYSVEEKQRIAQSFSMGAPATAPTSLCDIVNAAWVFFRDGMREWEKRYPKIYADPRRREQMLNDLVFKSIEVLEINEIQGVD